MAQDLITSDPKVMMGKPTVAGSVPGLQPREFGPPSVLQLKRFERTSFTVRIVADEKRRQATVDLSAQMAIK